MIDCWKSFKRQGRAGSRRAPKQCRRGFTLIELLVVIAIIALLISILLPSLQSARRQAKSVKCATHMRQVGQAMAVFLGENQSKYPPAYVYPYDAAGNYDYLRQDEAHPFGYLHWSWFLYDSGKADAEAFTCPELGNGGTPRTNPGPDMRDWELEGSQVDQNGSPPTSTLMDKQAPRIAFSGNAAIFPRNKFTQSLSGGPRVNQLVSDGWVKGTSGTILLAEYFQNWIGSAVQEGGGLLSKSHRSINPFYHIGYGTDEYKAPLNAPGFVYGDDQDQKDLYGIRKISVIKNKSGLIEGSAGPETNDVGRHHPGGGEWSREYGGTSNFLYCDSHVEKKHVIETVRNKEWGDRYYSITGDNQVLNGRKY
ncbi:MAG: prepilin-type N-terminal cleavage/methylation domain-containing protein [Phycisphaerales bacterium]|nr:prepilin-type N-terminal cleavage/methylation domain-containing protein [Phycisphaerales bacterium]